MEVSRIQNGLGLIEQASHAFLLEDPHGVAGAIQAFLHEFGDD